MTRRASRMLIRVLTITSVIGVSAYAISHRNGSQNADRNADKPKPVTLLAVTDPDKPSKVDGASKATRATPATLPSDRSLSGKAADKHEPREAKLASASVSGSASTILSEAKSKIDAGEFIAGRAIANNALMSGQLSAADAVAAKHLIAEANKTIIFSPRRFKDEPWATTHAVASGEVLTKIARSFQVTPELLLQINGMTDAKKLRAGAAIKVINGPFHLVVSKRTFNLDVYLGSPGEKGALFVTSFPVGLGKDDSTPQGTWLVTDRIPNPKWWGARGLPPIESGDPKNPLGKYWLALTGIDGKAEGQQSYGIHGTIEPESIGTQASMGCIRMRNEDVSVVYSLAVSGKTTVVVKD
jgi:lipoprotein-anchoring transpeptidase ErfK/SrfK